MRNQKQPSSRPRLQRPPSPVTAASSETGYGEAAAYVRSIRQSGHFDSYPALKLLLARQSSGGHPPAASERIIPSQNSKRLKIARNHFYLQLI